MKKQLYVLVALLVAATMVLTACGAAATTAAPAAPCRNRRSRPDWSGLDPLEHRYRYGR